MRAFRVSRIWLVLTLFALCGLVAAPAFALHCCCLTKSEVVAHSAHHAEPAIQSEIVVSALPPCHQHAAPSSRPSLLESQSAFPVNALTSSDDCRCESNSLPPAVVSETQNRAASFALVAIDSPAQTLPPVSFVADRANWPLADAPIRRSPFPALLSGRAPPVS